MNDDLEPILAALLTHLANSVVQRFNADVTAGSTTLANVTAETLTTGVAVFGPGVAHNAVISSFDATTGAAVMSLPATQTSTGAVCQTGFQTISRRLRPWTDPTVQQPALFLRHVADEDDFPNTTLSIRTAETEVVIYSKAGENPDEAPDIGLNQLVKAVRLSMAPDGPWSQKFTIGGLVDWCRIEGRSEFAPGDLDGQAGAFLPVKITLP